MDKLEELLKKKEEARIKLEKARLRIGEMAGSEGAWHDNAGYDLANQDFEFWSAYLEDLEKQIRSLKKNVG